MRRGTWGISRQVLPALILAVGIGCVSVSWRVLWDRPARFPLPLAVVVVVLGTPLQVAGLYALARAVWEWSGPRPSPIGISGSCGRRRRSDLPGESLLGRPDRARREFSE